MAAVLLLIVTLIFQRTWRNIIQRKKIQKKKKSVCELLIIVDLQWQKQQQQQKQNQTNWQQPKCSI